MLGFGMLLVVPIVSDSIAPAAGVGVSALLCVLVLLYLIFYVFRYRRAVAAWIVTGLRGEENVPEDAQAAAPTLSGSVIIGLAQRWHWFALAYLCAVFVIVLTQESETVLRLLTATAQILGIVMLAGLATRVLRYFADRGLRVSPTLRRSLPLLERRLNTGLRRAMRFVRTLIVLCAALLVADAVGVISFAAMMASDTGVAMVDIVLSLLLLGLAAGAIWLALTSWVDYRLNPDVGAAASAREVTLLTLLRNAATIALIVLTLMFALSEIGLNIGPLIASAGVLGLAIGFGAQKMVQDIITGIFIQFENAINVGDVISVNGTTGTVEKLSVRSVTLRDVAGTVHLIPFSSVDMVCLLYTSDAADD